MKKILIFLAFLATLNAEQIEINANSFEADENALTGDLDGNVIIKNGAYDTLWANHAKVFFDKQKKPLKYVATGNTHFKVLLKDKKYNGSGAELTYEPNGEIYTLSGSAFLHEEETDKKLYGAKIVINKKKGTYSVYSDKQKPVKFTFETGK